MSESSSTQGNDIQVSYGDSYIIKPRTISLVKKDLKVLVESPVDFASIKRNGVDIILYMVNQELDGFFKMLNGPSYRELIKDFWVRAELYDEDAPKLEEWQKIEENPSLKGKTMS